MEENRDAFSSFDTLFAATPQPKLYKKQKKIITNGN